MNRGDELLGWDTVHFPGNLPQVALALYHVVRGGGFGVGGGVNFDAKVRRQSIDPEDLVHAHAEAIDLCARALLVAEKMIRDDALGKHVDARYAGWDDKLGRDILKGRRSLAQLAAHVEKNSLEPQPRSGRQERLEALVNHYL
jgi:xylose isomerase